MGGENDGIGAAQKHGEGTVAGMAKVPVLADALRLILPREGMTGFLRACLLSGPTVQTACARWLGAPVPAAALAALGAAVVRTDQVRREAATRGVRVGARGRLREILPVSGWRSRMAVFAWMLAPSPAYLRWTHPRTPGWQLPACSVTRPLRFVGRRFRTGPRDPLDTVAIQTRGAAQAPRVPSAASGADS